MEAQKLLEYFHSRESEIIEAIRDFINIESPSYDEQGSREAVAFLESRARKISAVHSIEKIPFENLGEHLIIRAFENADEKPILLLGHTDTVHPRGSFEKNPTRIEADKFYGCGIFDMKANALLIVEILRAFEELNIKPPRPITILLSCDEEVGSQTGREFVEREAACAAFCLVCEPSANGKVKTGRKGTASYKFKAQGIPAHAGLEPEKGVSAILEIARQIPRIQSLSDFSKGTIVNVCQINGGTASNVIPEFAECTVDVRFTTSEEAERVDHEIRKLLRLDIQAEISVEGKINRPPLERTRKVNILYNLAEQVAQSFNYKLGETQVGGASDGNFVAALGVPVLDGLGIAGDGAHTNHEHILISDIAKRAALIAAMLL